jgi:carbonic anhydrase
MRTHRKLFAMAATAVAIALGCEVAAELRRPAFAEQSSSIAAPEDRTTTPEQAWKRLKAGNNRFADEMLERPDLTRKKRLELSKGQAPFAVVLTCADSRLTPEFIFNQGLGDLFVLRVAGNIVDEFELGSIEYAVEHLHVPLIVLLGHDNCGAVEAALADAKPKGNFGKLVSEVDVGKNLPAGKEAALAAAVENNARHHAHLLAKRSDVIRDHVAQKQLRIVFGVYRLASGNVDWLEDN